MKVELYRCDECNGTMLSDDFVSIKLLNFSYGNDDYQLPDDKPEPKDFCSVPCMTKWITKEVSKLTENGKRK